MIYCIWYPSGGFGHFINAVLSMYGKGFARPPDKKIKFGADGNSHSVELVAPKYSSNLQQYFFDFDPTLNYSVLIDNGINDESIFFKNVFPEASIVKICYSDISWPIVARTMINKAMQSDIKQELCLDSDRWNSSDDWAQREKYFLFLRDHYLRQQWKPCKFHNLMIDDILNYQTLLTKLNTFGIELEEFKIEWQNWYSINQKYIEPVTQSLLTIQHIKNNVNTSLDHISDLWSQSVLYYFIWKEFNKEVPHNDYADFFSDTYSIKRWLSL